MSESVLGRAKIPIEGDLSKLDKDLSSARSKVSSAVDGIVANVQKVGSAALAGVGIVSGVAAGAATALGKLAIDAAPVEGLQKAFEGLAGSSGKSMDEMLAALQRGSSGMISQRDLMQTYNKAGQLVSVTFANELPDAMDYLSKVSASTGQDMGFMLDSLVVGVGRLSPMILDNLGIQVSLEEATQRAADSFGVEASALDKTQIQAGMMEVVLEKLAANTAAMPDVSDSAAAGLARMKAQAQDTKDELGLALQPALSDVMEGVSDLAEKFLPVLIEFFEQKVVPVITNVAEFFRSFAGSLAEGASPADALRAALEAIGLEDIAVKVEEVVAKFLEFRDSIQELWDKVAEFLQPLTDFIAENVILQDVLIALAAIVLATVIPSIISMVASMGPILLVVAAVIAVVALLRKLCENDFALLKQAWAAVGDAFEAVGEWIGTTVANLGHWISQTWTDVKDWLASTMDNIRDGMRDAWEQTKQLVVDKIIGMISRIKEFWTDLRNWLVATLGVIHDNLRDAWEAIKQSVVDKVQGMINKIEQLWTDLKAWLKTTMTSIRDSLVQAWEATKQSVVDKVQGMINKIEQLWTDLKAWLKTTMTSIRDSLVQAWEEARQEVVDKVRGIIDEVKGLWDAMRDAGARMVEGLKEGIRNAWGSFLDWLRGILGEAIQAIWDFFGIGSPSKVFAEIGENLMLGLAQGIGDGVTVPVTTMMNASRDLTELALGTTVELHGNQGQPEAGVTIYGGLALYGVQDAPGLLSELRALAI